MCEEFKAVARRLYDKPNSIEELSEQREYMKQIPEQLKKNQELIDKAMIDYELIEEFNYNISAEDFNAKWVGALMYTCALAFITQTSRVRLF